MDLEDKKNYSDKWFAYLQAQICNHRSKNLFQQIGLKKLMVEVEHIKY